MGSIGSGFMNWSMPTWLLSPQAPAWAQAIFAALAIIGAVGVTTWQRSRALRDAQNARARQDKERLRRLTVGLRAELGAALQAAARQQETVEQTLKQVADAHAQGIPTTGGGPIRPGSMVVTDAIVYRQVAAEIGMLPPEIIKSVVEFYARALELGRLADGAPFALQAYEVLRQLGPRLRMGAALVISTLDKFEASGFDVDADIGVKPEEVRELASKVGYPLEEVMKERGLKL
jgi:hypothetical protein